MITFIIKLTLIKLIIVWIKIKIKNIHSQIEMNEKCP